MNSSSKPHRVGVFAGAIAILLLMGAVSFRSTRVLVGEGEHVRQSQEFLTQTASLLLALTDAETGTRGYTITGDDAFLEPYRDAESRAKSALVELRRLASGVGEYKPALDQLETLLTRRLVQSAAVVGARTRDGFEAAQRMTAAGEGKQIQDQIRAVIAALEIRERTRLDQHQSDARRAANFAQAVIVVGGAVALALAALAIRLSLRDLEARRRAEAAVNTTLSQLESRARLAMDAAKAGTWEWELQSGKNVWSEELWGLFSIPPHSCEPSYEFWRESIVPEDRPAIDQALETSVRQGSELNLEWRVASPKEPKRWLMSRGRPLRDGEGRIVRYIGVVIDITERKRTEEGSLRWQRLFASSQFGLASLDIRTNQFLDVNEAFAAERGYRRDELIGHPVGKVYPPEARAEAASRLDAVDQAGHLVYDTVHQRKDGSRFPVLKEVTVIRDAGGQPISRVAYALDISERKRIEQALQHRNEELVRFIYTVSHDLKSPLVTIRTFLGYLDKDLKLADAARVESDLGFIRRAAEKMSELLDEILELSRVGRKVNPPEEVSLQTLVMEAIDLVAGPIAAKQAEVQVTTEPVLLTGDRRRLVEVFQNLIDNAVKFAGQQSPPRIEIGTEENQGETVFFVRDNGIGIDPRHHNKLFGLFEKLHPGTPGTGIGLAIVKRIVEVHGGRIWAESAGQDQGSIFRFTLRNTRRSSNPHSEPPCPKEGPSSSS
jgi:PAS domain S-box-containing protein